MVAREEQLNRVFISCLRLGSIVDSLMTDMHKMEWRLHVLTCRLQAAQAMVPALMKQDRKRHRTKLSCEPWPHSRETGTL